MNGSAYQPIDNPSQIPQGSVDVYLNLSDYEIKHSPLPSLGFLDRQRYLRTRRRLQTPGILQGLSWYDQSLVEFTCPINDHLNQWLLALVSNKIKIQFICPLVISPNTPDSKKHTLVVSNHGDDNVRQTAFIGKLPIFTRLTHGHSVCEEIQATLSYLKHQYGAESVDIEVYSEIKDILSITNKNISVTSYKPDLAPPSDQYRFYLPQVIQEQKTKSHLRYAKLGMMSTGITAAATFVWQILLYQPLLTDLENKQQQLSLLQNQLRDAQERLPLETRLPEPYKSNLKEPSPIGTFMSISIAMVPEVILSDLKWERTNKEEKIFLEVKVINQDEETDQKLDAIKEFCANLKDAVPAFQVHMESLPHATGDQETFTGSTNQEDLTLAGDLSRGRILLIRKIEQ
jgi:hypothetical protein